MSEQNVSSIIGDCRLALFSLFKLDTEEDSDSKGSIRIPVIVECCLGTDVTLARGEIEREPGSAPYCQDHQGLPCWAGVAASELVHGR